MNILISGTSSGIGKAAALKFLKMGHKVYGVDREDSAICDKNYTHFKKDIRDKDLPIIKDVDVIVANAGVQDEAEAIDTNLNGSINFVNNYLLIIPYNGALL